MGSVGFTRDDGWDLPATPAPVRMAEAVAV